MPRHVHDWKPLFREPADPAGRLGYLLHRKHEYRACSCGMIQTLCRYARGGAQWRNLPPVWRPGKWEEAQEWDAKLGACEAEEAQAA